jgi:cytochrome c553
MTDRRKAAGFNRVILTLGAIALLHLSPSLADSSASSASTLDGEALYRTRGCSACHGEAGAAPLPEHPKLAGQDAAYLIAQLRDFKKGARTNGLSPSMWGYVRMVPDEELVAIGEYLAKQSCR